MSKGIRERYRIRPVFQNTPILIVGIIFTIAFCAGLYWLVELSKTPPENRDLILLFSVYIAGMGWVTGLYYTTRYQRKQHTINVLLMHTNDNIYHKYAVQFNQKYPPFEDTIINLDEVLKDEDLRESIRYMLNEYEFIAAGIKRKDLDYLLMKDTIRGQFCTLYRKCEPFICHVRGEKKDSRAIHPPKYPKVYEHLKSLYEDWSDEDKS